MFLGIKEGINRCTEEFFCNLAEGYKKVNDYIGKVASKVYIGKVVKRTECRNVMPGEENIIINIFWCRYSCLYKMVE